RRLDSPDMIQQTVILAAGIGTRLGGLGGPKPLMTIGGLPLIAHALAHAEQSGCKEALIVIGHEGSRVRQAVEALDTTLTVQFVHNPDPTTPNGHSLLAAEHQTRDRFFLQMVDHLFGQPVLKRLSNRPLEPDTRGRVLVDRAPVNLDLSDATKVR